MNEGIRRYLPMFLQGDAGGGTSFWLTGPPHFDADIFATRLQKRGVLIEPGHVFFDRGIPEIPLGLAFPR